MSEQGSRVAWYVLLAVLTAAAFSAGWILRGRAEKGLADEAVLAGNVEQAAAAADVLSALAASDADQARERAKRQLEGSLRAAVAAAEDGVRLRDPLETERVLGLAARVAAAARRELSPEARQDARKLVAALRGEKDISAAADAADDPFAGRRSAPPGAIP